MVFGCLSFRPLALRPEDSISYKFTLNYEIGRRIVEEEQGGTNRAQYCKEVIRDLAARLTSDFGNGFSKSNLEYMRRFYLAYPGREIKIAQTLSGRFERSEPGVPSQIAQTVSGQFIAAAADPPFALSWSHYVFLLGLKEQERKFYEIEAAQQSWTLRDLRRQFDSGLYDMCVLEDLKEFGVHVVTVAPALKLWRDSVEWLGLSASDLPRVFSKDDKYRLKLDVKQSKHPLRLLFFLEWSVGKDEEVTVLAISPALALSKMMEFTHQQYLVTALGHQERFFELYADLLAGAQRQTRRL